MVLYARFFERFLSSFLCVFDHESLKGYGFIMNSVLIISGNDKDREMLCELCGSLSFSDITTVKKRQASAGKDCG